jgi:Matrixin
MRTTVRSPLRRISLSCAAAGLLAACGGGGSPAAPTAPAVVVATPPPDNLAPGGVLQVVSAEDASPIDGATVTIGGKSYTSAGGRITLQERVPLRSEIDIVAGGMLERRTLARDAAMTSFALWPSRSATGMDEGYTQAIVYTHPSGSSPLRRLARGTTRVAVVLSADIRADPEAVAAHQEAVDRMTAASGGQVVYALATQAPASGVWVDVHLGAGDSSCDEDEYLLGYEQSYTRNGEITRAVIVYCDYKVARTSTPSHEMGHTFGLFHSPDKGELMYAYYNGHGGVDFSSRESLEMRLMLQRPAGNVFPDDDRTAAAAAGDRVYVTRCPAGAR